MKLRTEQVFDGRQVRLGDVAIVCVNHAISWEDWHAHAATCIGFEGDLPTWRLQDVPWTLNADFVDTEDKLKPQTWTW